MFSLYHTASIVQTRLRL